MANQFREVNGGSLYRGASGEATTPQPPHIGSNMKLLSILIQIHFRNLTYFQVLPPDI